MAQIAVCSQINTKHINTLLAEFTCVYHKHTRARAHTHIHRHLHVSYFLKTRARAHTHTYFNGILFLELKKNTIICLMYVYPYVLSYTLVSLFTIELGFRVTLQPF